MRYVDAIDGLRAIAVILVLLFHAGYGFAQGGFAGVDVFFVISGFLITGIIARDIENCRWSFRKFYLRRIVRLGPALFITVLVTLLAGCFILTPEDLEKAAKSGTFAAASISNIFFWLEAGYFDQAAASKPFLHTWSLGVEEQFYLVWPAIIFLLAKFFGRKGAAVGLGALGLVSLASALALKGDHPEAVFFLTPFRVHQFALGGLIALMLTLRPSMFRDGAGFLGVAIIFAVAYYGSGEDGPYWLNALAPAIGAALFIWSAEAKRVTLVFASAPMVWIGKRSYSIYLTHWPIMVLWPMATDFELSTAEKAISIAASVVAGALLHGFVERPLRFKTSMDSSRRRKSVLATSIVFILCIASGVGLWASKGLPERTPDDLRLAVGDLQQRWDYRKRLLRTDVCNIVQDAPVSSYKVDVCASPKASVRSYMIIGDSYASDAYLVLPEAYPDVYFGQLTLPGCVLRPPKRIKRNKNRPWCSKFYNLAFKTVASQRFDGVVFASAWEKYQPEEIEELVAWAKDEGLEVIVMAGRPKFKERIPTIILSSLNRAHAENRTQQLLESYRKAIAGHMQRRFSGQFNYISLYDLMCDEECEIFDKSGNMIYLDNSHVSVEGAAWLADRLKSAYPELFDARAAAQEK